MKCQEVHIQQHRQDLIYRQITHADRFFQIKQNVSAIPTQFTSKKGIVVLNSRTASYRLHHDQKTNLTGYSYLQKEILCK